MTKACVLPIYTVSGMTIHESAEYSWKFTFAYIANALPW